MPQRGQPPRTRASNILRPASSTAMPGVEDRDSISLATGDVIALRLHGMIVL